MAFREVGVIEVVEMLRLWLLGHGYRAIARMLSMDRKTVRRYVEAAQRRGMSRPGTEGQPSEELIASVVSAVRPSGPSVFGEAWGVCAANRERLREWLEKDLRLTKINELLTRQTGQAVPYRTLHRFCVEELCFGKRRVTVRVDDGKPGEELQVDFGRMGRMRDEKTNRERVVWALILTACYSRHQFVFLTFTQGLSDVIEGFEKAWGFFGGVFRVVIPDNLKAVVTKAGALAPRINETFLEYAQARGFVIDPARVRKPDDKPRVERQVSYVRDSFFRGEEFHDLSEARRRAEEWCRGVAGGRVHGTTQRRPLDVFEMEEKPLLLPAPQIRYDTPLHVEVTVAADHHVRVDRALYSVPTAFIGQKVHVRADHLLVAISASGERIKTHPRQQPGGRSTDPNDYPEGKAIYATRDVASLLHLAQKHGDEVGLYAQRLLQGPLPWSRMRHVYRLLSLVKTYGGQRVSMACHRALELDVVDITRVSRMLQRALESRGETPPTSPVSNVLCFRFQREPAEFAVSRPEKPRREEPSE
jgi:transposase